MLDYERVCQELCNRIAILFFDLARPSLGGVTAAASATRDISAALHYASGTPDDPRWSEAFASLGHFIDVAASSSPGKSGAGALLELRSFLEENRGFVRSAA